MLIIVLIIIAVCILGLILVWPGRGRRDRMQDYMKRLIAHRGFHDNLGPAPENSMAAYRLAVEKGLGIELDVRRTADGQLVCMHDRNVKRAAGVDRNIDEMNWPEVKELKLFRSDEGVPRFRDVLSYVDGRVPIIMEIKAETFKDAIQTSSDAAALLDSYEGLLCMESFHPLAVWWFRKNRPRMLRGQLSDQFRDFKLHAKPLGFLLGCCAFNCFTKPDFIAYNVKRRNLLRFRLQHNAFHAVCAAWTVKSPEELISAAGDFDIFIFEGFDPGTVVLKSGASGDGRGH